MVNTDPQTKAPAMGTSFEDFQAQAESEDIAISWTMNSTQDSEVYTKVNIIGEVGCLFFIDGQGRVSEEHFQQWVENHADVNPFGRIGWTAKGELGSLSEVKEALLKEHGSDEYIFIDHQGGAAGDEFVSDPEKKSVYIIPWENEATADEFFLNIGIKSNFTNGEDLTLKGAGYEFVLTPKDAIEFLERLSVYRLGVLSEGDVLDRAMFMVDVFVYLRRKYGEDQLPRLGFIHPDD